MKLDTGVVVATAMLLPNTAKMPTTNQHFYSLPINSKQNKANTQKNNNTNEKRKFRLYILQLQ